MQRVIKFRSWYEGKKVMIPFEPPSHMPLMQYTGLKDKNNKLIYEGDLFRVANNQIYTVKFILEEEYEEVTCGFGLVCDNENIPPFIIDTFAIQNGEVIGNIYENPELLTK